MTPSKTTFAGLQVLDPGDSLSTDGYAILSQNPVITDKLGKLGAVTHQHDAHAAMANPTSAATVVAAATGGSIPAATPIHVVYTLTDASGGETLQTTPIVVTTSAGYLTPAAAPTLAVSYSAGALLASTPLYSVTVTDGAGGETALGPAGSVTINPGHANAEVLVSGLTAITNTASGSSSSSGWRLWKSVDGGSTWNLMATGAHGTNTFTDDGSSGGDCTVNPPRTGTTVGTNKLTVTVPSSGQPAGATFFSIYANKTGQFVSPCRLGTYAVSDYDVAKVYTSLTVLSGQPPAVSSCYPGANKIDPVGDLNAGSAPTTGDVLTATSSSAASWQAPSGGGFGSGGPLGSALGVQRIIGPTGVTITASATTNITIPVPAWAQTNFFRVVLGLIVTHPNVSQLAATLTDATPDTASLFVNGSFTGANIGLPSAPDDPDSYIYFSDRYQGYDTADGGFGGEQITNTTALNVHSPPETLLPEGLPTSAGLGILSFDATSNLTLAFTETAGSAGTLVRASLYLISCEFDAISIQNPIPSRRIEPNAQSSSYTLILDDANKAVEMNVAGGNTLTVPPFGTVAFPVGTIVEVFQRGAGQTTLTPGAGVTIRSHSGLLHTAGQYSTVRLRNTATNEWVASGDLA